MAKKPSDPKPQPQNDPDDLPVVQALGIAKVKGGWAVVKMETQGKGVLTEDVLSGPDDLATAWERYRVFAVKELYRALRNI